MKLSNLINTEVAEIGVNPFFGRLSLFSGEAGSVSNIILSKECWPRGEVGVITGMVQRRL